MLGVFVHAMSAVFMIFALMAVGYVMGKLGWMNGAEKKFLSRFVINIAVPMNCITGILNNFTREDLAGMGFMLAVPFATIILCLLISVIAGKLLRLPGKRFGVFVAMAFLSNTMFIGLPLSTQLFGEVSVGYVMIYYMGGTVFTQTVCVMLVEHAGKAAAKERLAAGTEQLAAGEECLAAEAECLAAGEECLAAEAECLAVREECLAAGMPAGHAPAAPAEASQPSAPPREEHSAAVFLKDIFTKPPILGLIAALGMLLLGVRPPEIFMSFAKYLSSTVSPLALIYCGYIVYELGIRNIRMERGMPVMLVIRLLISPMICALVCGVMGVTGLCRSVFIVEAALPTVSQVTVMAGAYGADEQYTATGSILSMLGIFITIPILMVMLT